jgi:hypothetical protein
LVAEDLKREPGNLEVATHWPDGPNLEKRYPLLYGVFAGARPAIQALSWIRSRRSAVAAMRRAILLKIGA